MLTTRRKFLTTTLAAGAALSIRDAAAGQAPSRSTDPIADARRNGQFVRRLFKTA